MSRQFLLGLLVVAVVIFVLWVPARALLFGSRMGRGASGEWVGTMTITQGYPHPGTPDPFPRPLAVPLKAAVYLKLSVSDGFMDEYSGPGELHVAGDTNTIPFRLSTLRIGKTPGANFSSDGFATGSLSHVTYSPAALHFENMAFPGMASDSVSFTADLHPGSRTDYQTLFDSLQRQAH